MEVQIKEFKMKQMEVIKKKKSPKKSKNRQICIKCPGEFQNRAHVAKYELNSDVFQNKEHIGFSTRANSCQLAQNFKMLPALPKLKFLNKRKISHLAQNLNSSKRAKCCRLSKNLN